MKELYTRLRNAWLTLTNYDANQMMNLSHAIMLDCVKGQPHNGNIKITKNDGTVYEYSYSVTAAPYVENNKKAAS